MDALKTLVTGFGPFGEIRENPSSWYAAHLDLPYDCVEVSYETADEWIESHREFDRLLMIGVADGSRRFRLELIARNEIGSGIDIRGIAGPASIDPRLPQQLGSTLWPTLLTRWEHPLVEPSYHAGSYLCNYLYFRALASFPDRQIGFLHVPKFDEITADEGLATLKELVTQLNAIDADSA